MRIAHVTDFYLPRLGGIEMHVSDLAARQVQRGHDVTVVTSSPGDTAAADQGVRVVRVTDGLRRPRAIHPRAPFLGAAVLLSGGFDVVHVHVGVGSPLGFWGALRTVRAGIPTVVTVHSLWSWAYPIFRTLNSVGGYARAPLRWTAVSEAAARPVRRVLGDGVAVSVLPNGIDGAAWRVPRAAREPDEVVLVAVMRLAPRKRPRQLLRMLAAAQEQVNGQVRLRAVIVGDGPELAAMRGFLRRHAMTTWVTLAGRQTRDQIRDLYRQADVFVAPADLESFGIAALEARCAGVPVVAKAASGIAEFVRHAVDGLLVADDADMVRAIVQLCLDPHLRAALTLGCAQPAPVSWTSTLLQTDAAYAEAAVLVGRPPLAQLVLPALPVGSAAL